MPVLGTVGTVGTQAHVPIQYGYMLPTTLSSSRPRSRGRRAS